MLVEQLQSIMREAVDIIEQRKREAEAESRRRQAEHDAKIAAVLPAIMEAVMAAAKNGNTGVTITFARKKKEGGSYSELYSHAPLKPAPVAPDVVTSWAETFRAQGLNASIGSRDRWSTIGMMEITWPAGNTGASGYFKTTVDVGDLGSIDATGW